MMSVIVLKTLKFYVPYQLLMNVVRIGIHMNLRLMPDVLSLHYFQVT